MRSIDFIQALFQNEVLHKMKLFTKNNKMVDQKHHSNLARHTKPGVGDELLGHRMMSSPLLQTDSVEITSNNSDQFLQFTLTPNLNSEISFKKVRIRMNGREGKNGKIDPEYCHLLFSLELNSLKETVIDVRIQNRIVSLNIYNKTPQIDQFIEELKPLLKANLVEQGYILSTVKVISSFEDGKEHNATKASKMQDGVDVKI